MTSEPQRFTVASRTCKVSIEAALDGTTHVKGGTVHAEADGSFSVTGDRQGTRAIVLRCPPGSHVSVGTLTGRVDTSGPLGDVRVVTETGNVRIDRAERIDVRARSGSIEVGACAGECRLVTASGRVEVGRAGVVEIASQSGKVEAGEVGGGQVRTVSGSIRLGLDVGARGAAPATLALRVMSSSGGVEITVPPGLCPAAELHSASGRITSSAPVGGDGSIEVRTTSGSIRVGTR